MSDSMYHRLATLSGPRDAILSVALSPDGKFVAAAGEPIHCHLYLPNGAQAIVV